MGITGMDLPVYEWLKAEEYERWVCPHMRALLGELEQHGNGIRAVGLVNYKSPEAIIFLKAPLLESVCEAAVRVHAALQLGYNGLGHLHVVACNEHYVSARFSEQPA